MSTYICVLVEYPERPVPRWEGVCHVGRQWHLHPRDRRVRGGCPRVPRRARSGDREPLVAAGHHARHASRELSRRVLRGRPSRRGSRHQQRVRPHAFRQKHRLHRPCQRPGSRCGHVRADGWLRGVRDLLPRSRQCPVPGPSA